MKNPKWIRGSWDEMYSWVREQSPKVPESRALKHIITPQIGGCIIRVLDPEACTLPESGNAEQKNRLHGRPK